MASVETCSLEPLRLEQPIVEYSGDHVYLELRHSPEEEQSICFLPLAILERTVKPERDLDELVLFDASSNPPEQRFPRRK